MCIMHVLLHKTNGHTVSHRQTDNFLVSESHLMGVGCHICLVPLLCVHKELTTMLSMGVGRGRGYLGRPLSGHG